MAKRKMPGVYEIVNVLDGKRYVGSSVHLTARRDEHFRRLRKGDHHSRYLQSAWDKHGEDAFIFRVICRCDVEDLLAREQEEIDRQSDYNMTKGAGSCLGRVASEETRAKMSAARKGRNKGPRSEQHCRNISAALKGKPRPESAMAALQAARRAYKFTDEDRKAIGDATRRSYAEGRRDRTVSEEHRRKIAETLRGRKASEEARANQSAAQTGKKRGPYNLDPAKAEARREAGKRLAASRRARRQSLTET